MAKYVPSGKINGAGLISVFGVGITAAVVMAGVVHFVGRAFYLILLFPIIWGFVVGGATAYGVKSGKCRNAAIAGLAGLFAAGLTYAVFHELDNWKLRKEIQQNLAKEVEAKKLDLQGASVESAYEDLLKEVTGKKGFWGEVALRARAGMNISRAGRSSSEKDKPMITGVGMYVYWGIELAIIAGCALVLPLSAAREVYCEDCQEWYKKVSLATLGANKVPQAVEALSKRDVAAFGGCVGPGGGGYVMLEKCPSCQTAPLNVIVEASVKDNKGKETRKSVYQDLFTREEANQLIQAATAPQAAPPEKPAGT